MSYYNRLGTDVRDDNDIGDKLRHAGLDYKVCKVQAAAISPRTGNAMPIEGQQSIHRSDGNAPSAGFLGFCSKHYIPSQNSDSAKMFNHICQEHNLTIERMGEFGNGERVFAYADTGSTSFVGDPAVGDVVSLGFLLTDGHVPGIARTLAGVIKRLACSNGMVTSSKEVLFRQTHRGTINQPDMVKIREAIAAAAAEYAEYMEQANRMRQVRMSPHASCGYIAQVLQPDLLAKVAQETEERIVAGAMVLRTPSMSVSDQDRGRALIDKILQASTTAELFDWQAANRAVKHVARNVHEQPGATLAPQTLWNTHNAVTHYVDHLRGRRGTGVQSAYFGEGKQIKRRALDLAVEYTQAQGVA
jgi:hypothetical protein